MTTLSKTVKHGLEMGLVCGIILLVLWLASLIGLIDIASVKDAVFPMILAALGSMVPKYVRTSPDVPVKDYVNE